MRVEHARGERLVQLVDLRQRMAEPVEIARVQRQAKPLEPTPSKANARNSGSLVVVLWFSMANFTPVDSVAAMIFLSA